jgi:hypothetical protein
MMTTSKQEKLFSDNRGDQNGSTLPTQRHTPAALALHNNFLSSMTALKRSLIRGIHYLRIIYERKVYRLLGYSSITEYAQKTAGISRNQTEAFLALGKKLDKYPEVAKALGQGELSFSKARIIVAKAESSDEKEWIELARSMSTADLRTKRTARAAPPAKAEAEPPPVRKPISEGPVTQVERGSIQSSLAPHRPADEICYVTYKFTVEEYTRWSSILETLRKQGSNASKEQLVLRGLAGLSHNPGQDAGGPGYLLHINKCPECDHASLRNSRGLFEVEQPLLKAATCDAVVESEDGVRRANISPRLRRMVLARDGHHCQRQGCGHTQFLEIHHRLPVAQGGKIELENLITLCSACHRDLHRREEVLRAANRDPIY